MLSHNLTNLHLNLNLKLEIGLPISDVEEDDGAAKGSGNNYISFPALATSRSYADIAYRHVALPLSEAGNIQHQSHC